METRRAAKEQDAVTIKVEQVNDYDTQLTKNRSGFSLKADIKEEIEPIEEQFIEISTNSFSKTDQSSSEKSKALTKNETRGLLDLIQLHPIIATKRTNSTNNKQKIKEWNEITEHFNATCSVYPRTPKQLRLKWENLKKKARKRNANIRWNRGKTDLTTDFIPRDEILEKVSTLLRKRRRKPSLHEADDCNSDDSEMETPILEISQKEPSFTKDAPKSEILLTSTTSEPNEYHQTNRLTELPPQKKKLRADEGREARNRAIAGYYTAKTKLMEANLTNIHLRNEKLQLEIDILKRTTNS